jgi:glycosyltransferase involved in cell wall biosynthesis
MRAGARALSRDPAGSSRKPPALKASLSLRRGKIRILHVIASLAARTGGPAKAVVGMARAVAKRGHAVAIYATDRELDAAERGALGVSSANTDAVTRDGVETRIFAQQPPRVLATSWPLYRALEQAIPRADVVHIHSLYLFHDWAAARIARRAGVPYIVRPHGTLDPFLWKRHRARKRVIEGLFQNRVLREAAAIHYTAAEEMALAAPYVFGAPGVVVPNGLDLDEYAALPPPGGLRARHPEIGDRRIVLFLGRLNFKKGLDLLVPGFAAACAQHGDLHLVIAGPDDGMLAPTRALVASAGIAERVTFAGMVVGAEKLAALADAYCFALPSYSENFGIAIVEAMACGLAVAISDKVNIWSEVASAGAGLVGPPSAAQVTRQLAALAADPAAARRMGEAGRALARKRYSWDGIAGQLEDVYRSLAPRRSAA